MPRSQSPVDLYVESLSPDRREAIREVRAEINRRLPEGYEEGMLHGMIAWTVPHRLYPPGYHCDPTQPLLFAGLSSRKTGMTLHLPGLYGDAKYQAWFEKAWRATGKRLDSGKGCVRFERLEDVPLELVGEAVARIPVSAFVRQYEASRPTRKRTKPKRPAP